MNNNNKRNLPQKEARLSPKNYKKLLKEHYPNFFDHVTDGILELKDENFVRDKASGIVRCTHPLLRNKYGMIMFYESWCKYSKSLKDTWSRMSQPGGQIFPFTSVNCEQQRKIAKQLNIQGVPNFQVVYPDGTLHGYNGPRTSHHFEKQMVYLLNINTGRNND